MERGFFEVITSAVFTSKQDEKPVAEVSKGSPTIITFSNNILLTLNPRFGGEDLWRCLSILEASHVV